MKRLVGTVVVLAVAAVAAVGLWWGYNAVFVDRVAYYVQVDDACADEAPEGDNAELNYTLTAYDESGAERELTFGTQKRLRDGAYLKLDTLALRGVVSWEEVQWDEVPAAAQEKLPEPDGSI